MAVATDTTPRGQTLRDTVVSATHNSDASGTHTDDDEKADGAEEDGASDVMDNTRFSRRDGRNTEPILSREAMSAVRLVEVHTQTRIEDNLSLEDSKDTPPSGEANEPQAGGEHSLSSESAEEHTRHFSGNDHTEIAGLAEPADSSNPSTHAISSVHCDGDDDEGGKAQIQVRDQEENKLTQTSYPNTKHNEEQDHCSSSPTRNTWTGLARRHG
jgi:hypothetical protein